MNVEKLEEHLKKTHRAGQACPWCGKNQWNIVEQVSTVDVIGQSGEIFPFTFVMCTFCGNTLMFNAKMIGLVYNLEHPRLAITP